MVNKRSLLVIPFVVMLLFLFPLSSLTAAENKPLVVDQAGLFTAAEAASLVEDCQALGQQYAMDIVLVTADQAGGKSSQEFADDFYDQNGYGSGEDKDGILFLIDMDNREVYISTSGEAIRYLTDDRIESILNDVYSSLSEGDMFGTAQLFLISTGEFLAQGIPQGPYNSEEETGNSEQPANSLTFLEAGVGAAVAVISGLIFYSGTRKKYRGKPQPVLFNYRQNSQLDLAVVTDTLVNSFVTTRIIPKNNSSGGGGSSTHRSSSGRSHGGGGRKF